MCLVCAGGEALWCVLTAAKMGPVTSARLLMGYSQVLHVLGLCRW